MKDIIIVIVLAVFTAFSVILFLDVIQVLDNPIYNSLLGVGCLCVTGVILRLMELKDK